MKEHLIYIPGPFAPTTELQAFLSEVAANPHLLREIPYLAEDVAKVRGYLAERNQEGDHDRLSAGN